MNSSLAAPARGHSGLPGLAALLAVCLTAAACGGAAKTTPHTSVADRCAQQAKGDPAEMSLCLASHHIIVPDSVRSCVRGVRDGAKLIECLREAAR
jgi:hypothetical protein